MTANFRRGRPTPKPFEILQLPVDQRRQICLDLLEEFGAEMVSVKGDEITHRCQLPFNNHAHGDTTGKARVNFEKMVFSCWVCGGGGFLWWVATMRGESTIDVVDWLAREHGVGSAQDLQALMSFLDSLYRREAGGDAPAMLPHYDTSILDQWRFIHPYLTDFRRISVPNIVHHSVGYGKLRIRVGKGADDFVHSERVVIPHFWDGQLVGWQSRRLTDDGTPKYAATAGFPRDTTIFNFDRKATETVVVEAPISVVANTHVAHFEATFGSAVTATQLDLLAQHNGDFLLWFDNDPAGWHATEEVGEWLSRRTPRVFVIDSPYAADPADMNPATVASALREWRVPWVLWTRPAELLEWRRPDDDQEVRDRIGGAR